MSAEEDQHITMGAVDLRGAVVWMSREYWGLVIDALIEHRHSSSQRSVAQGEPANGLRTHSSAEIISILMEGLS